VCHAENPKRESADLPAAGRARLTVNGPALLSYPVKVVKRRPAARRATTFFPLAMRV
jgi:hypothetical protein